MEKSRLSPVLRNQSTFDMTLNNGNQLYGIRLPGQFTTTTAAFGHIGDKGMSWSRGMHWNQKRHLDGETILKNNPILNKGNGHFHYLFVPYDTKRVAYLNSSF